MRKLAGDIGATTTSTSHRAGEVGAVHAARNKRAGRGGGKMKFLRRRLVHAAILLVGVSMLTLVLSELAPGNFFDEMKLNPQISPETIAGLKARYALDQPLYVRYGRWIESLAHGEMGFSFAYDTEVMPLIWSRAKNTLLLTITAMMIAWMLAILAGVWSA